MHEWTGAEVEGYQVGRQASTHSKISSMKQSGCDTRREQRPLKALWGCRLGRNACMAAGIGLPSDTAEAERTIAASTCTALHDDPYALST